MARVRSHSTPQPGGGTYDRYFLGNVIAHGGPQGAFGVRSSDYCADDVGYPNQHGLEITKTSCNAVPLSGVFNPGNNQRVYSQWMPGLISEAPSHNADGNYPTNAGMATTLLARTNPGRSEVSIPVFVGELRDLPGMVKLAGESILKKASSGYLAWQFGWKPLFSDLRKMLDFQATVAKRERELVRLYSKGGLKRRMNLGNSGVESVTNQTIASEMSLLIDCRRSIFTERKSWGTVRWLPTSLPTLGDQPDLRKLARKAVFGLDIQAVDAWNLIPWTWLIDWFSNAGDFLEAHANRVPCTATNVCIMTTTSTQASWTRTDGLQGVFTGGYASATRISKTRYVGGAGFSASLPFLNGRQLSILSALAIQRLAR
jgi:hypothetical protein